MAAEKNSSSEMCNDFDPDEEPNRSKTVKEAGSIQAIDRGSVHRICSGQVVLTLATAVKELVENSIDAGANTVEIKLKEYGSESIEVSDNGSGVQEENFEGLTLKHHTSKLTDFSDLANVTTFGFRGEALSSLCALSKLTIMTRHDLASVGTKLEFDGNGRILCKTPVPRQRGTTIIVQNLFHTLPVRHREFQNNLKREFGKMVQVLNAYCLIHTGVRITYSNQSGKGNRSTVVATNGNSAIKENIANIFGPKQLQSLLPFQQHSPDESVCSDFGISFDDSQSSFFSIDGFISKCEHGLGRSSTDRQFVFINRRPCDATKILKTVNEVYHTYNRHQYPFLVLLVSMDKESVDINVTPDKRQIFMEREKLLLATIKFSLIRIYEPTTSVYSMNIIPLLSVNHSIKDSTLKKSEAIILDKISADSIGFEDSSLKNASSPENKDMMLSSLARLKRSFSSAFDKNDLKSPLEKSSAYPDKQRKLDGFLSKSCSAPRTNSNSSPAKLPDPGSITRFLSAYSSPSKKQLRSIAADLGASRLSPKSFDPSIDSIEGDVLSDSSPATQECSSTNEDKKFIADASTYSLDTNDLDVSSSLTGSACEKFSENYTDISSTVLRVCNSHSETDQNRVNLEPQLTAMTDIKPENNDLQTDCKNLKKRISSLPRTSGISSLPKTLLSSNVESCSQEYIRTNCCADTDLLTDFAPSPACDVQRSQSWGVGIDCAVGEDSYLVEDETKSRQPRSQNPSLSVTFTEFDAGKKVYAEETEIAFSFQKLQKCLTSRKMSSSLETKRELPGCFRAKISPTDNENAEAELRREISKDMFANMEVLGQFNLGFIIARNGQDLFIVDQHATDEKYNFEMLQKNTILQTQQLIRPQCLELTASNETILVDNLHIFKKNGFDFVIHKEAPPTQRVKLISTPLSKNWNFGKEDIEELIFMLTDSPGVMCRPSRVRMMFASRACRKSVMIGTALSYTEMKKLLCHMGEIEQPWNCPHGRPTMRHLINLNMLPS